MAMLVLLAGCARDNPLYARSESESNSSGVSVDASSSTTTTTSSNASAGSSSGTDGSTTTETTGPPFVGTTSAAQTSSSSTGFPRPECAYGVNGDVVAQYRFEDPAQLWVDDGGNHDGDLVAGVAASVLGPAGCGNALGVTAGMAGRIGDAPGFDLPAGAIDFWVLAPNSEAQAPLLSRDALGAATEHVTFLLGSVANAVGDTTARHLIVRHQSLDTGAAVCSEAPLPAGAWVHVAYNFGPPGMALYIDGVLQESTDEPDVPGGGIPACDGRTNDPELAADPPPFVGGLETNMPWFIAASAQGEPKSGTQSPSTFMDDGALDELRISSVRRDFASL